MSRNMWTRMWRMNWKKYKAGFIDESEYMNERSRLFNTRYD